MRTSGWWHCLRRAIRSKQSIDWCHGRRFRADIEAMVLIPEEMRKSSAGRKPLDAIVMFRMLVLQALNRITSKFPFHFFCPPALVGLHKNLV
jgi:hypothetical protein